MNEQAVCTPAMDTWDKEMLHTWVGDRAGSHHNLKRASSFIH